LSTPHPEAGIGATDISPITAATSPTTDRDELKLTVPGVFALLGQPRAQYEMHITRVSKDVLKEASNLATGRPEGSRKKQTEFHSDHVDRAFQLIAERGLKRKARPGWYTWGRITQGFCTLLTGGAAAMMTLPGTPAFWGYCFVGSFAVTFLLIVVLEVADRSLAK
jgi:hypothetical protein